MAQMYVEEQRRFGPPGSFAGSSRLLSEGWGESTFRLQVRGLLKQAGNLASGIKEGDT